MFRKLKIHCTIFHDQHVVSETESEFVCEKGMDYLFLKGLVIAANKAPIVNGSERVYTILNLIGKGEWK